MAGQTRRSLYCSTGADHRALRQPSPGRKEGFGHWVRGHLTRTPSMASAAGPGGSSGGSFRHSDLRLLRGVMGAPLSPISSSLADPVLLLSIKGAPIVRPADSLPFDAVYGLSAVRASGLGLDPLTTAGLFAEARCVGEKKVNGENCFILKLSADPQTLKLRSEGPAEIIRHVLFRYFSQRTGLIVHIEDSHLTRMQPHSGGDVVYSGARVAVSRDAVPVRRVGHKPHQDAHGGGLERRSTCRALRRA